MRKEIFVISSMRRTLHVVKAQKLYWFIPIKSGHEFDFYLGIIKTNKRWNFSIAQVGYSLRSLSWSKPLVSTNGVAYVRSSSWFGPPMSYPTFSLKGLGCHLFLSIKGNSLMHHFRHLCLLENNLSDNPGQHHFLGLGQLLGSLPGRLLDAVGDDRHDHEDVAKPEQDPDDEAWMASKQMSSSSTGKV